MGVLTSPTALRATEKLLVAAEDPTISVRQIRWPSMERVLRLLRTSFADSATNPLTGREVELVQRVWAWARVCLDGPVSASHVSTGFARLQREIATAEAALDSARVASLRLAIEQVAASEHPASKAIAELISIVDLASPDLDTGKPSCVLIVRGDGLQAVQEWVVAENLCADVVTANQARVAAPWQHAILFGPPERYVASGWLHGAQAAASAGWLLFAPAAPAVTVLTWAGHQRIVPSGYAPWEGAPTAPVHFDKTQVPDHYIVPDLLQDLPLIRTPSFSNVADDERVEAYGVQLQVDGKPLLAYFSALIGPKPLVAMGDDDGINLQRVAVATLKAGDTLLFRTSIAGIDALDKTTEEWFLKNHDAEAHHDAVLRQHEIKHLMATRIADLGHRQVVGDLVRHGIQPLYAQMLPSRLLQKEFIAPQHYSTYEQLCMALQTESVPDDFALLKMLRTGRRQAGQILSRRIAARLEEMPELSAHLRDRGGLMLDSEGVEGVALFVAFQIDPELVSVPASRLGALIDEDGRPWHR